MRKNIRPGESMHPLFTNIIEVAMPIPRAEAVQGVINLFEGGRWPIHMKSLVSR